ncbi:hypothetical protein LPC27_06760 [Paraclostridium bifermentans]|uniref:O-antigen ligase like membrane family protein n=1 Tax=Paraclostridium bifermentans TaxID=1490 RepID=UPI00038CFBB6|nr:O-antigen ligase like membrane family protein [Paraclostridium bifermentans]EQK45135.1 O-antigen ligase like membrane family protein [[Clostridium] bifermentans ATCC 19299] [Paraclostridium bifermentans ATCC 19299]MCE9675458.1 hypothetical protein [Paraclostridium bifermentans]
MIEKKKGLNEMILWTFIVFSGFYINLFKIKPVYITSMIGVLGYIFFELKNFKKTRLDRLSKLSLIWAAYMSFSFLFIKGDIGTTLNSIMSVVVYFVGVQYLYDKDNDYILKISKDFINISIVILIIEFIIRFCNPNLTQPSFYKYKFNSIMYEDSNYVGIFIICLFFYSLYLSKYKKQNYKYQQIILFLLCILTISRAAIISTIVTIIGIKMLELFLKATENFTNKQRKSIILLLIFVSLLVGMIGMNFLLKDGSFRSKFYIADLAFQQLRTSNFQQLIFGIGFGRTSEYIGIGAHNILIAYLLESGIVGILFFIIFTIQIALETKGRSLIVTIPFLIAGMSLAGFTLPFLYLIYAMIYTFEMREKATI